MVRLSAIIVLTLFLSGVASIKNANAQSAIAPKVNTPTPALLGKSGDWAAYSHKASAGTICYAISKPKFSVPQGLNRDQAYFMISNRPSQNIRYEINILIGYPFKKDGVAKVKVAEKSYSLFTRGDGAWVKDPSLERRLVENMKAGAEVSVEGTSWRGTVTKDIYSLIGVTAALKTIDQNCR